MLTNYPARQAARAGYIWVVGSALNLLRRLLWTAFVMYPHYAPQHNIFINQQRYDIAARSLVTEVESLLRLLRLHRDVNAGRPRNPPPIGWPCGPIPTFALNLQHDLNNWQADPLALRQLATRIINNCADLLVAQPITTVRSNWATNVVNLVHNEMLNEPIRRPQLNVSRAIDRAHLHNPGAFDYAQALTLFKSGARD